MAKKKDVSFVETFPNQRKVMDNNPSSGLCPKPNDDLEGCRNPKHVYFADMVAKGEAKNAPDVIVRNANGTSSSFGEGSPQYNWGDDQGETEWNNNRFKGGNLTGM